MMKGKKAGNFFICNTRELMDIVNHYDLLKKAFLNEFNCPELLPYETELIREIGKICDQQEIDCLTITL